MSAISSSNNNAHIQHILRATLLRSDRLLAHLSRILATPSGIDSLLQTLQYTLVVVRTQLSRLREWQLHKLLVTVARKASTTLLPGEAIVATVASPTTGLDSAIGASKALSDLISDFRIFFRLWGLLGIYDWAKSTWNNPPRDAVIKAIVWTQVLAGFGFQWYENLAYLAMKGVLRGERFNERKQTKWWEWSSRFWMAHVALDVVRLARVWQLEATTQIKSDDDDDGAETKAQKTLAADTWKRELVMNTAWAPITAHYSWEHGCLTEHWVGLFGLVACGTRFRQIWKQTG